jgi:hypothetical protein
MACSTMRFTGLIAGNGRIADRVSGYLLDLGYSIGAVVSRIRNTLALRLASIMSGTALCALNLSSPTRLNRASLLCACLLLAFNLCQFLLIVWELRPIALQGEELALHSLVFPNLPMAGFKRLMRFAKWRDGKPGEIIAIEGSPVTEIIVLLGGGAVVERSGQHVHRLGAGAIVGEIGALGAQPFSSTIRLTRRSRYLAWEKGALDRFFACHPALASGFQRAFILRLEKAPLFQTESRTIQ